MKTVYHLSVNGSCKEPQLIIIIIIIIIIKFFNKSCHAQLA